VLINVNEKLMNVTESISYNDLKKWLPKGYTKTLHTLTGYTTCYVSMVLSGKRNNEFIWKEAIGLAEQNKKEKEAEARKLEQKIKKLKA